MFAFVLFEGFAMLKNGAHGQAKTGEGHDTLIGTRTLTSCVSSSSKRMRRRGRIVVLFLTTAAATVTILMGCAQKPSVQKLLSARDSLPDLHGNTRAILAKDKATLV